MGGGTRQNQSKSRPEIPSTNSLASQNQRSGSGTILSVGFWDKFCDDPQLAVVILAIVSTKPQEHFTRGAGGYFAAMVKRAKTGVNGGQEVPLFGVVRRATIRMRGQRGFGERCAGRGVTKGGLARPKSRPSRRGRA